MSRVSAFICHAFQLTVLVEEHLAHNLGRIFFAVRVIPRVIEQMARLVIGTVMKMLSGNQRTTGLWLNPCCVCRSFTPCRDTELVLPASAG